MHWVATGSGRHPRWMIGLWVVAILFSLAGWRYAGEVLTTGITVFSDTESRRGDMLIEDRFAEQGATDTRIVCAVPGFVDVVPPSETLAGRSDPSPLQPGTVSSVGQCYQAKWAIAAGEPILGLGSNAQDPSSPDGGGPPGIQTDPEGAAPSTLALLFPDGMPESITLHQQNGEPDDGFRALVQDDLIRADRIALPLAFLILLLVVRTWFSPFIPVLIGGAAVAVAVGLTVVVARFSAISLYVVNMIVMIGLAVGIDYTLLILERFREERRAGGSPDAAIAIAMISAGRAVLASGMTVVAALAGMLLVPISLFREIAAGGMLVVALGVLAALTLLPAVLHSFGDRIDCRQRNLVASLSRRDTGIGMWARLASVVTRRPVVAGVTVLVLLGALSLQALDLQRGLSASHVAQVSGNASGPASDYWEHEVTATLMSVVEIVVDSAGTDDPDQPIERLITDIGQDDDFAPIVTMQTNDAGDMTVIRGLVVRLPNSSESALAVERLRSDLVPQAFGTSGAEAHVSGPLAVQLDVVRLVEAWQARIVAVILGMSVIILTLAYRSVVVPVVAALTTLVSLSAAIGAMVLVIQKGYGASLLGLEQAEMIEVWVPIVLFCILFGLSMDYHVFLLSRIQEQYRKGGGATTAVAHGVRSTGGIICGAALIMVIVFACFATGRLLILQQIGFGLAVAILIDAFLVRLVLVPAAMTLLGRWNWYLPGWLHWLPAGK